MSTDWMCDEARKFYEYLILKGRSQETAYQNARHVHHFLTYVGKKGKDLSRDDIIKYLKHLSDEEGCSRLTVRNVAHSISSFLKFLGMTELARWVPVPVGKPKEAPWMTEDLVMKVVDNDPILRVAYELALRVSELLMLKRSEYNPETGDIVVYRLKHKGKPNRYLLRLSDSTRKLLNEYLRTHKCPDGKLFCISRRAIQGRFKRALRRAGLDPRNTRSIH
jgi:integrase